MLTGHTGHRLVIHLALRGMNMQKLSRILSTVVLSATVLYGLPAMAIEIFPGSAPYTVGLADEDIILHRMDDEFYTESWYFMGQMLDGTEIFIHYGLSNAGFGSFTGAIETTIIDKDGTVHFEKTTVKKDKIKYDEKRLDIDFDGEHSIEGTPARYHITSQGDELGFDLVVTPYVPGLKFGDGTTWFDKDHTEFYSLAILTPKGKMEGSISVRGEKRNVRGYAYGDHAWQNYPAHKMADRLFSMRGFDKESSAAFLIFVTEDFTIPTLVLTKGKEVALATTAIDMVESQHTADEKITKYRIPGQLDLRSKGDGPKFTGKITFDKRTMRQDPTKEFNFFERTLIKMFVAKPILYRHDGHYSFTYGEVSDKKIEGKGVIETMILR